MIIIEENDITVSKGDDINLSYSFIDENESQEPSDHILSIDDKIIFTVKQMYSSSNILILKEVNGNGTNTIDFFITSTDLNKLEPGIYKYDIRIKTKLEGVKTPFKPAKFTILEVIGDVN